MPKEGSSCIFLLVILRDSVFKVGINIFIISSHDSQEEASA